MATRSKAVVQVRGVPVAMTTLYTTPAQETLILKEWRLRNGSATTTDAVVLRVATSGACVVELFRGSLAALASASAECWTVLMPGDVIQASSTLAGTALNVWVSGAELEGVTD